MRKILTLGSLFDGISGFPLAGKMAGMHPVWASEIEPFPIRVAEKRLPEMRHYGNIFSLHGAELEPVDTITFGSPCQDLSIAGKREGLSGGRSSLFFEAVRVIREMREATHGNYPRWAVWENVPGALSAHHGEDFRQVLESFVRVKEPEADVPLPTDKHWLPAGEIMGDGYSLAWRILDAAQGWGVAQRRKRVFVVLDFNGQRAGQVLFESEGMSRYTPPGGGAGQGTAGNAESGAGTSGAKQTSGGFCIGQSANSRSDGYGTEIAPVLRTVKPPGVAIEFNPTDTRIAVREDGICQTLCSRMGTGGNQVPLAMTASAYGICATTSRGMLSANPKSGFYQAVTSRTLDCGGGNACRNQGGMVVVEPAPSYSLDRACFTSGKNAKYSPNIKEEINATLMAEGPGAVSAPQTEYLVRRLTPGECCRLQGFPDGWCEDLESPDPSERDVERWTDIFEEHRQAVGTPVRSKTKTQIVKWLKNPNSDTAQYKAYGNSVAVPCVFFVLAGIVWVEGQREEKE